MGPYADIDKSRFPLVLITFTGADATDESFDQYLKEMRSIYDSEEKLAVVFDARSSPLPSLKQQQRQAQWLKTNDELLRTYCVGTAYVITTGATRMILRMIFAITQQPVPYKICSNMDDAEEWALAQLSA